jgi:hypothetical protein
MRDGAMHLAERGGSRRLMRERLETLLPAGAEPASPAEVRAAC